MREIVQERLVSIEYEALDQQSGFELYNVLDAFLKGRNEFRWRLEERLVRPMVVMPNASLQSEEPDWSKMQMFVDRCYRYRAETGNFIIQFCKDFMTINVIADRQAGGCPRFDELQAAFEELMPFISDTLIKRIRLKDLKHEVVYHLDEECLSPLLSSRYCADRKDYLDVFGLLRSFASNVNDGDWELDVPLRQELIYHIKGDPQKKRLWENIVVGHHAREGWSAIVQLRAYSELICDMRSSDERLNAFVQMLPEYDKLQMEGLRRLLTDEMYERLSGVVK